MSNFKGFIGNSYFNENIQYEASRSVNLYLEADENASGPDEDIGQMVSTPGLTVAIGDVSSIANTRGCWTDTAGNAYFASGSGIYQILEDSNIFSADLIGTILTTSGPVRFADNVGLLWIVDGPNGYVWQNSIFTQILDPSWQGADFVVVYDDQFIFNVPGTNHFYWADINSPTFTVAGGAGVDAKQGNSDPIIGITVFARLLWLIGSQTTEIWTDNPGGTTTFQRIPGPYLQLGCLAPGSIAYSEFGTIWVATNQRGGAIVVMTPAQGYSTTRISNFCVEQQLQKYGQSLEGATAFIYQQNGHTFYVLNPVNGTSSWVYDITMSVIASQPCWHERTYTNAQNIESRALPDNACTLNGFNLVGDYKSANIYFYDFNNFTDNGAIITRRRITTHVAGPGFTRVFHNALTIECRTGVGKQRDAPIPPGPPDFLDVTGSLT